jgi:hypothetical protein
MSKLTKESLAARLNGRQMGHEILDSECAEAARAGLVVVFGYSDDNAEFRGAINDEVGCYDGGTLLIIRDSVHQFDADHARSCECPYCGYAEAVKSAARIEAIWGKDGYSWTYRTEIPHATFDIMEDGEKFCRGIVFERWPQPK